MVQGTSRRWTAVSIVVVLSLLLWPAPREVQATDGTTFSGRAIAVRATVLGLTTALSDTGPLPESGGSREASLLAVDAGGLSAEVLHASTVGQGDRARSEASVANVSLTLGGNTLSADFLSSEATATCGDQGPTVSGQSQIVNLAINGLPVIIAGPPNQTVDLPNGRVVINEQAGGTSGRTGEITVNALHIVVTGIADIVVASAHADISCGLKICDASSEFVTGGGWIMGPSGARANFAVAGGKQPGWGHLMYIDHGPAGLKVKGTSVTAYASLGGTARRIEGTAELNGQPGYTYSADVADNGEPGRMDTFALRLSSGYVASGMLEGGNLQLHNPCR